jgi:hypothetical protein
MGKQPRNRPAKDLRRGAERAGVRAESPRSAERENIQYGRKARNRRGVPQSGDLDRNRLGRSLDCMAVGPAALSATCRQGPSHRQTNAACGGPCGERRRSQWRGLRWSRRLQPVPFGATIRRHRLPQVAVRCRIGLDKLIALHAIAHRFCVLRAEWCQQWCQTTTPRLDI